MIKVLEGNRNGNCVAEARVVQSGLHYQSSPLIQSSSLVQSTSQIDGYLHLSKYSCIEENCPHEGMTPAYSLHGWH